LSNDGKRICLSGDAWRDCSTNIQEETYNNKKYKCSEQSKEGVWEEVKEQQNDKENIVTDDEIKLIKFLMNLGIDLDGDDIDKHTIELAISKKREDKKGKLNELKKEFFPELTIDQLEQFFTSGCFGRLSNTGDLKYEKFWNLTKLEAAEAQKSTKDDFLSKALTNNSLLNRIVNNHMTACNLDTLTEDFKKSITEKYSSSDSFNPQTILSDVSGTWDKFKKGELKTSDTHKEKHDNQIIKINETRKELKKHLERIKLFEILGFTAKSAKEAANKDFKIEKLIQEKGAKIISVIEKINTKESDWPPDVKKVVFEPMIAIRKAYHDLYDDNKTELTNGDDWGVEQWEGWVKKSRSHKANSSTNNLEDIKKSLVIWEEIEKIKPKTQSDNQSSMNRSPSVDLVSDDPEKNARSWKNFLLYFGVILQGTLQTKKMKIIWIFLLRIPHRAKT
jgi:hypothetical protein